ncbi:MAG: hypothetical protein R3C10_25790 [Pirellulales bacterium]
MKVRVVNEMENDEPLLKAGMYARVSLPSGQKRLAVLVPKDALVLGGNRPMLYVVDSATAASASAPANPSATNTSGSSPGASAAPGSTVRPVPVTLGVAIDRLIQVIGPIKPGDLVVTRGNERLRPGQLVQVQQVIEVTSASDPGSAAPPRR